MPARDNVLMDVVGDARARGVNFLLGPGVNIARSPVNGRNFEYLSEDPFLNGGIVRFGREDGVATPLNAAIQALVKGVEASWTQS